MASALNKGSIAEKTEVLVKLVDGDLKDFLPAKEKMAESPYAQIAQLANHNGIYRSAKYKDSGIGTAYLYAYIQIDGYKIYSSTFGDTVSVEANSVKGTNGDRFNNTITSSDNKSFLINSRGNKSFNNSKSGSWVLSFDANNIRISESTIEREFPNGVYTKIR